MGVVLAVNVNAVQGCVGVVLAVNVKAVQGCVGVVLAVNVKAVQGCGCCFGCECKGDAGVWVLFWL